MSKNEIQFDDKSVVGQIKEIEIISSAIAGKSMLPRHSYYRNELLSIKEKMYIKKESYENLLVDLPKVFLKICKPNFHSIQSQLKSNNSNNAGIVLCPQKRSWNIGCHVAPLKQETSTSLSTSKPKKNIDRSFSKQSDIKRDKKPIDKISPSSFRNKEKIANRTASSSSFYSRSYSHLKNDKNKDYNCSTTSEKEPEWFLEGPSTINDTIELGGIMEDNSEASKDKKNLSKIESKQLNQNQINSPVNDSAIISIGLVNPKELITQTLPVTTNGNFPNLVDNQKSEVTGSRFRHLFNKCENTSSKDSNLSSKLLNLLACSKEPSLPSNFVSNNNTFSCSNKSTASELEVALRSLLLRNHEESSVPTLNSHTVYSRNAVPTVQEIEAAAMSSPRTVKTLTGKREVLQPISPVTSQNKKLIQLGQSLTDSQIRSHKNNPTLTDFQNLRSPFDEYDNNVKTTQGQEKHTLISLSSLESVALQNIYPSSKMFGDNYSNKDATLKSSEPYPSLLDNKFVSNGAHIQQNALVNLMNRVNLDQKGLNDTIVAPKLRSVSNMTALNQSNILDPAIQSSGRPIIKSFNVINNNSKNIIPNRNSKPIITDECTTNRILNFDRLVVPTSNSHKLSNEITENEIDWKSLSQHCEYRNGFFVNSSNMSPQLNSSLFPSIQGNYAPKITRQQNNPSHYFTNTASLIPSQNVINSKPFSHIENGIARQHNSIPNFSDGPQYPSCLPVYWQDSLLTCTKSDNFPTSDMLRDELNILTPKSS